MRILVVCLDNVGDLVFSTSLLSPLRKGFADAEIDLWCKTYTSWLTSFIPEISQSFATDPYWDSSPGRKSGSRRAFLRTILSLRKFNYDVAIIASQKCNWRVALGLRLAGVKKVFGFFDAKAQPFLSDRLDKPKDRLPIAEELALLTTPLGFSEPQTATLVSPTLDADRSTLLQHSRCARLIGLHPFAGNPKRRMDLAEWFELADHIVSSSPVETAVVWIGTEDELNHLRQTGPECSDKEIFVDQIGMSDARVLASLDGFVGHDSGPIHVASAFGVPCFGIYYDAVKAKENLPQGSGRSKVVHADAHSASKLQTEVMGFFAGLETLN